MSLNQTILARISVKSPGWVFTPGDFFDLGSPQAVGMALLRLSKEGKIRRFGRGLYDLPRRDPDMGLLSPDPEAAARAMAHRQGSDLRPTGATAANLLGLSEQVPAVMTYLTNGGARRAKIKRLTVELKPAGRRELGFTSEIAALTASALRSIGRGKVAPERLEALRGRLSAEDRQALLRDIRLMPAWMHPLIHHLVHHPVNP